MKVNADGYTELDDPAEQDFPPEDEPCPSCAALRAEVEEKHRLNMEYANEVLNLRARVAVLEKAVEWAITVVDEVASKMTDKPTLYHDNKSAWVMMGNELRRMKEGR